MVEPTAIKLLIFDVDGVSVGARAPLRKRTLPRLPKLWGELRAESERLLGCRLLLRLSSGDVDDASSSSEGAKSGDHSCPHIGQASSAPVSYVNSLWHSGHAGRLSLIR